jgi:hypothetical protein
VPGAFGDAVKPNFALLLREIVSDFHGKHFVLADFDAR